MDAGQALAELTEISPQIELAVVFDLRAELVGSTLADESAARSLVERGVELLARADRAGGEDRGAPTQIELALPEASVLLVREGDLRALAITSPDPIAGLAFFDLMLCLRKVAGMEPKARRLRVHRGGLASRSAPGKKADETAVRGAEDEDGVA
jgi:hypothetical protein